MLIFLVKNASKIQYMLYDETNQTFFWLISQFSPPIYSTSCYSQDSLLASSGYLSQPEMEPSWIGFVQSIGSAKYMATL